VTAIHALRFGHVAVVGDLGLAGRTLPRHRRPHCVFGKNIRLVASLNQEGILRSQQLGHRDPSITLRVYSHWLPDTTTRKGVEQLDDARLNATQARPDAIAVNGKVSLTCLESVVSLNFASWNQLDGWLRQVEGLRRVA
jgi:hypothetical protein